jgi:hypothetical protein
VRTSGRAGGRPAAAHPDESRPAGTGAFKTHRRGKAVRTMGTTLYKDYMELAGPGGMDNSAPMGRLYNFHTSYATLNETHKRWIREILVPLFSGAGTLYVYLWGYASKIGNAAFNTTTVKTIH